MSDKLVLTIHKQGLAVDCTVMLRKLFVNATVRMVAAAPVIPQNKEHLYRTNCSF